MSEEFKAIVELLQNTSGNVTWLVVAYFVKGFILSLVGYGLIL